MAANSKLENFYPYVAIGFGTLFFLVFVLISPIGCSFLPVSGRERFVTVRDDPDTVLFSVSGRYRCLVTIHGPFPEWDAGVGLKFKNREEFLNFGKSTFVYPEDFISEGHKLDSGTITLDKERKQATLKLKFIPKYYYNRALNGVFDMSKPRIQASD